MGGREAEGRDEARHPRRELGGAPAGRPRRARLLRLPGVGGFQGDLRCGADHHRRLQRPGSGDRSGGSSHRPQPRPLRPYRRAGQPPRENRPCPGLRPSSSFHLSTSSSPGTPGGAGSSGRSGSPSGEVIWRRPAPGSSFPGGQKRYSRGSGSQVRSQGSPGLRGEARIWSSSRRGARSSSIRSATTRPSSPSWRGGSSSSWGAPIRG